LPLITRSRLAFLALLARFNRAIAEARDFSSVTVVRSVFGVWPFAR
jgi:hypothetical protein